MCTMSPGLDVSDGFKLDVNGSQTATGRQPRDIARTQPFIPHVLSIIKHAGPLLPRSGLMKIFDKEKINVYPIIDAIKTAEPSTGTIISAIQTVFGEQIKTAMNDAAKAVMPDKIDFTVNMGKLIAANGDAAKADAGFAGDILPGSTRRLLAGSTPPGQAGDDGVFNMGNVPASSNPDSTRKTLGAVCPCPAAAAAAAAAATTSAPPPPPLPRLPSSSPWPLFGWRNRLRDHPEPDQQRTRTLCS